MILQQLTRWFSRADWRQLARAEAAGSEAAVPETASRTRRVSVVMKRARNLVPSWRSKRRMRGASTLSTASLMVVSIVLVASLLCGAPRVYAASFTVNSIADAVDISPGDGVCDDGAGNCTLRAAIMETNAVAGSDVITLPAGIYVLTIAGSGENNGVTGDLDITDALTISGAGQSSTIIDGGDLDRVLHVFGSPVEIADLTVRNGFADPLGGGIEAWGELTLLRTVVRDNVATSGGGVHAAPGQTVRVIDSVVTHNQATFVGGGLSNSVSGALVIERSTVSYNEAQGRCGGGVWNTGFATLTLTDSSLTDNRAGEGGGGLFNTGHATILRSSVDDNIAGVSGGGVLSDGRFGTTALMIDDSLIVSNSAAGGVGGGLYIENRHDIGFLCGSAVGGSTGTGPSPAVAITNSTLSGNTALSSGGGLYNAGGTVTVFHSTIAADSAGSSGSALEPVTGTITVASSIIAADGAVGDCGNTVSSLGYNIDSDGTCGLSETSDQSNTDPSLGALSDNGGRTLTHAPLVGSPVIDAVPLAACVDVDGAPLVTDQRGVARPQGAACDIGAFELVSLVTLPPLPILEGDEWRYFKGTAEPSADWSEIGFDDSSWPLGPSGFGYGDGDDATRLGDMRLGYSTLYVRHAFSLAAPSTVTSLTLSVDFDDGFVAHLNGTEIARQNVGSGTPEYNDSASAGHEAGAPVMLAISPGLLVAGQNVLALHGLNFGISSSDFSLIPELSATISGPPDETPPADPTALTSPSHEVGVASTDPTVEVNWPTVDAGGGASDAGSGVDGYSWTFTQGAGDVPDAVKDNEELELTATSGVLAAGSWWFHLRTVDNAGNWTSTAHLGPFVIEAGPPVPLPPLPIVEGDEWRYFKGTSEPPADWNAIGFNDSGWLLGPSGFGYGDGDDTTVLGDMRYGYSTLYARRAFAVLDPSPVTSLTLSVDFDDGFVAYLNGTEIARQNAGVGTPAYDDTASAGHEAGTPVVFAADPGLLVAGENVLTVHGLNRKLGSSDFSLIPELTATISGPPTGPLSLLVDSEIDEVDASLGDGICATAAGDCTLRAAIMETNAFSGPDTITLPAGLFGLTLSSGDEEGTGDGYDDSRGDLDVTDDVSVLGAGAAVSIIASLVGHDGSIFEIAPTATAVLISGVTLQDGSADDHVGEWGGGIRVVGGGLSLEDSVITGGYADNGGGGLANLGGTVTLRRSWITDSSDGSFGAALESWDGPLTIIDSTISQNPGGYGLLVRGNSIAMIRNSTISTHSSGGLVVKGATILSMEATTLADNGTSGGIQVDPLGEGFTGSVTVISSIVADGCGGLPPTSSGFNIDRGTSCSFAEPTDRSNTDPLLGPLADNGGPTTTHALLSGSAAIDSGTDVGLATDQRGVTRPQGLAFDIGAFEAVPTVLLPSLPIIVGDEWRYFKGTSKPPVRWNAIGFDDSGWLLGPSGLGYGDGDDATLLTDMRYSYSTLYARRAFEISDPSVVTSLTLSVDFDDGFVAYLNGTEIARQNAGVGTPAYNDTASAGHEAGTPVVFAVQPALLLRDANVLAIHGLNRKFSSSDFSLIPELSATTSVPCVPPLLLPLEGGVLDNGREDRTDGLEWDFSWGSCPDATAYQLFVIHPGAAIPVIDVTTTGSSYSYRTLDSYISDTNRFGWVWRVRALRLGQWDDWSPGRSFDVEPVNTDPPRPPVVLPPLPIIEGDEWRYFKGTAEPPPNWDEIGFDDSAWLLGPSGFGYGDGDDATLLTDMRYSYSTLYARRAFEVSNPSAITSLTLSVEFDDGFVAYLNGTEIARQNAAAGTPAYDDTASAGHEAALLPPDVVAIDPALLVVGENVLAVHGLNRSLSSSDFSLIPELATDQFASIRASVGRDFVCAYGFLVGPQVNLSVLDAPGGTELATATAPRSDSQICWTNEHLSVDLQPGMVVEVTNGHTTQTIELFRESFGTWGGGSLDDYLTVATGVGALALSGGEANAEVIYVIGAPDFVNAAFVTAYPSGFDPTVIEVDVGSSVLFPIYNDATTVVPSSSSIVGIPVDGCVTALTSPQFCPSPPIDPGSFTTLTSLIQDPGIEFTDSSGAIQADFDGDSLTVTVLGGYFDLYFSFSSSEWQIQSVTPTGPATLGISSLQFDQHSIVLHTDNTVGENYPHTAAFTIEATRIAP